MPTTSLIQAFAMEVLFVVPILQRRKLKPLGLADLLKVTEEGNGGALDLDPAD